MSILVMAVEEELLFSNVEGLQASASLSKNPSLTCYGDLSRVHTFQKTNVALRVRLLLRSLELCSSLASRHLWTTFILPVAFPYNC
jgi:hypothetical protein